MTFDSSMRRRIRDAAAALAFCLAFVAACIQPAHAQVPDTMPDLGLQRPDGAGGLTDGVVHVLARQRDGKLLVGGDFSRTRDGTPRTDILRLNPDGSLDEGFSVEIASAGLTVVRAIAVADEGIFIAGLFTHVGGSLRNGVARLGFDGSLAAWAPHLGPGNDIHALALSNQHLYVGGDIVTADAFGVARLSRADGAFDTQWHAPTQVFPTTSLPSAGNRGRVNALLVEGGEIFVGGFFRQIAGSQRNSVARLSLATPVTVAAYDAPIASGQREVFALQLDGAGSLYVGGEFFSTGVQDHLVRTDATTGALDTTWLPQPAGQVRALALAGSTLYVGGNMLSATQQFLMRVAVQAPGSIDSAWQPLPDDRVFALLYEPAADRLHVGGEFVALGIDTRNGLARYSMRDVGTIFFDGFEGAAVPPP